jgi:hypothetical protein
MPEYTIEQLEQMLMDARLSKIDNELIQDTPEEIEDREIQSAIDCEDILIMSQDRYDTMISHIWKSLLLNKILIYNYVYIEDLENDIVVGRRCFGKNRYILQYNDNIPEQTLIIIEQQQFDRNA